MMPVLDTHKRAGGIGINTGTLNVFAKGSLLRLGHSVQTQEHQKEEEYGASQFHLSRRYTKPQKKAMH